jgi:hypothetical protein
VDWLEGFGLSLWGNITFIKQFPEEHKDEELMEINKGSDNWDLVPFVSELSRREELKEGGSEENVTSVSDIVIWSGRLLSIGREMEGRSRSCKDSKSVWGRERKEDNEDERENEEERKYGFTVDTGYWSNNMSEVTKSLYPLSNDINSDTRGSSRSPSLFGVRDEESPETHMSNTKFIPDSWRSSIDNPNLAEALRTSIVKELIKIFESAPKFE